MEGIECMAVRPVEYLRYRIRLLRRPKRYANLFATIYENRCRRLVEIGTWNGVHAQQMIRTAALRHPVGNVEYYGFDLFEQLTEEDYQREFSKRPPPLEEVRARLEDTGAQIQLFQGNTMDTLPQAVDTIRGSDLIFVDGGHSLETVASDWENVRRALAPHTVVIFDDYYHNQEPEVRELGSRPLLDSLDRSQYVVDVLDPVDEFPKEWGTLRISMVRVKLRASGSK